ncbi:hypothetical protein FHG87_009565 [Trinorchestia longiramus]|nr:hypothetical protein FHG87_009565 [Trinorchestia longiramus]
MIKAVLNYKVRIERMENKRCKALRVNRRTWRWNEGNTRLCQQCNRGVEETVEHLVLECSKYEQERKSLMDVVHEQCGENKWNARRKTLECHPVVCACVLEGIEGRYKGSSQTLALDLSLRVFLGRWSPPLTRRGDKTLPEIHLLDQGHSSPHRG